MTVFWSTVGVIGLCALWLGLRYRRYRRSNDRAPSENGVTPEWLNENVYNRRGDDRWK
jgi:hypothetical protein